MAIARGLTIYVVTLVLLILVMIVFACGSNDTPSKVWFISSNGEFRTDSVARAQEELSFYVLVPKYLPSDLGDSLFITGSSKDILPADKQKISITYNNFTDSTLKSSVVVTEVNNTRLIVKDPSIVSGATYLQIGGVEIARDEVSMAARAGDDIYNLDGLRFWWHNDGMTFGVEVYGYSQEEAIRIVASMIEQE